MSAPFFAADAAAAVNLYCRVVFMNIATVDIGDETDLEAHLDTAVSLLLSQSASRVKRAVQQNATVDALVRLFDEAARYRAPPKSVVDRLSKASPGAQAAVAARYEASRDMLADALEQWHSPDPRLVEASWELAHSLGDRTKVPEAPTRSLPALTVRLGTTHGDMTFRCTAEQAYDMITELDAAVASASRVAHKF